MQDIHAQSKNYPAPSTSAAPSNSESSGQQVVIPDSGLWQSLLWMRDHAAGGRSALIIGEGAALAGILFARLGIVVRALDPEATKLDDAVLRSAQDSQVNFDLLGASTQREALLSDAYETVVIAHRCSGGLRDVLRSINAASSVKRLIIVYEFGHEVGDGDCRFFPRWVVEAMAGFSLEVVEMAGGQMRVVLQKEDIPKAHRNADAILDLTEEGAGTALATLRRRIAELEFEHAEARDSGSRFESLARELRTSTSFRLGYILVTMLRSPRSLLRLPANLLRLFSERKQRDAERAAAEPEQTAMTEWQKEDLRDRASKVMDQGADAVASAVSSYLPEAPESRLAFAYLVAAQECGKRGRRDLEFELASMALEMNHSVGMLRGFLHVALRARRMEAASHALRELHVHAARGNHIAKDFLHAFKQTSSYKIAALESIPSRRERWRSVDGGRLVYVLHNTLPYSSGGYATRSHGVASGLLAKGRDVVCVSRPGFPLDVKPNLAPVDLPIVDRIDGVPYQRLIEPRRTNIAEYQYVRRAMGSMEAELRRLRPSYVQAASNYVTALPALVAARRIGVPFIYEVRGLWEITRLSRDEKFGASISFDVQRHIESTVAREADHVFTLTEPMREELIARGVQPDRITLLPNSVDAERFQERERDAGLAAELGIPAGVPVIGYIGTFVIYEGLEDLAAACVELHEKGLDFRLLLVGNENASGQERGPITEEVLRISREGGIESKLIMPGRIPHQEVEAYYSLVDICPFPRKPWPVCEMVSPMKPLEALAMKKAVVVSSVRALVEMIQHDVTGVVFEKGNVQALAKAIADLIDKPDKRRRLGHDGREWVVRERSWEQVADRIESVLAGFDAMAEADDAASEIADSGCCGATAGLITPAP